MKGRVSTLRTVSGIAFTIAVFCFCSSIAYAQSFTSTYRLAGKSLRGTISPQKSIVPNDDTFRIEWKQISKTPTVVVSANETDGPYFIIRKTGNNYDGYGMGNTALDHIKKSKKIEIHYADGFKPEHPFVLRWVNNRYEVANEDFEIEKMFKVANELYFLQYRPEVKKVGTKHPLSYNHAEILNSFAFPMRKHRIWKGVDKE